MTTTRSSHAILPPLQDDESKVRDQIEAGWKDAPMGNVVWGDRIGYNDYVDLALAVTNSIMDRDFEPLLEFFGNKIDGMMDNLDKSVQEFGEAALRDLLLRAFLGKGKPIQEGRLEISAGIAEIDYWYDLSWGEPRTYKCKWRLPFGGWTWGWCTTTKTKKIKMYQLPKYLPYIRYRASGLPELPTSGIIQQVEAVLMGQSLSKTEIERIITEKVLQVIEKQFSQIPIGNIQSMVLVTVQRVIAQYGTTNIPSIIDKIVKQVDDAIANSVST
jgi:hypothetical protein